MTTRRSPGEYINLASLAASLVFLGYLILFGMLRFQVGAFLGVTQVASFVGLGVAALWLLIRRRTSGALLCMVFYGIQVLSITFPSGLKVEFNSLPAIYFRIHGTKDAPLNLNLVAFILFVFSVFLWSAYRQNSRPSPA